MSTPEPPRFAYVENNRFWQEIIARRLPAKLGGIVDIYPTCEELLALLSANPGLNYTLYILDNDLGLGKMTGPQCIPAIQQLRPGARVFGLPGDDSSKADFARAGADIITKDAFELNPFVEIIRQLLP